MSAGKYRYRIQLYSKGETTDSYGQKIPQFSLYRVVWADLQIGSGREFYAVSRRIPELSGIIVIRYDANVLPNMRIVYGSQTFEILAIIPRGYALRDELELHVKEILV
jgi:SPP1 family predicted phage head-tail adaptor